MKVVVFKGDLALGDVFAIEIKDLQRAGIPSSALRGDLTVRSMRP